MNACFPLLLSGVLAAGTTAALAAADGDEASSLGMHNNVVFTLYSPLSVAAEIVHRMLSPLDAERVMQASMRNGKGLQGQAIDLSKERFATYVPREAPSGGYGVFVYVSPYEDAAIPPEDWCVFAVADYPIPWTGHKLPDAASFNRLLNALEREERPAAEKVAACRARLDAAVTAGIGEFRELTEAGKLDKARRLLERLDARFSGLTAPQSVELEGELTRIRN